MPLRNIQYDAIMRKYNQIQLKRQRLLEERRREVYDAIPAIRQLEDDMSSYSIAQAKRRLEGESVSSTEIANKIKDFTEQKELLLTISGYPVDYLQPSYECSDCKDTGYIDGKKCQCFKRAAMELLYQQSNMQDVLQEENFDTFTYQYYTKESLPSIKKAVSICKQFVTNFDRCPENLLLYGSVGIGKTFLSHCIAKELIESGHSVVYFTASQFFEVLAKHAFDKSEENENFTYISQLIYDCDLLIIDDLGTELVNTFVASQLFQCINQRFISKKSTIISTNLSLETVRDTYSDRIFSRITSNYILLKLIGEDIRIMKKKSKITS